MLVMGKSVVWVGACRLHCLTARCVAVSGDRCMGTWEGQQQEQAEGRKEHGEVRSGLACRAVVWCV